jgi:hypothetical protein
VKARVIDARQSNQIRETHMKTRVRSQYVIRDYLIQRKMPAAISRLQKRWQQELLAKKKR